MLANDTNVDGNPLTAQLQTGTSNGYLILNPDGSFMYIPSTGYIGPDSFTYTASDGEVNSTPATVNITVYPDPVAVNATYAVIAGQTLEPDAAYGVLAFDSNTYGNPLIALLQTGTSNGSLTLNTDGSFLYVPNMGYAGPDSFTYTATDGATTSSPATVNITVYSGPVAVNESYAVIAGQNLTTAAATGVLAFDSNAVGNPLTAQLFTGPTNGQLMLNGDGSFNYSPNAGFIGSDSFIYTTTDGITTSAPATVTLTVYSVPLAVNVTYSVSDGQTLAPNAANGVLANDSNADGNPLTAQLVSGPANGQLTLNADGSFSYMPNSGFVGTDSFSYAVTDGEATSTPAIVSITVYNSTSDYSIDASSAAQPSTLPTITSFTPITGGKGAVVTISGTNFTGANAVSFGGTAASSFTVTNASTISATVGTGATGPISVTTPGGKATSNASFTYNPVPAPTMAGNSFNPKQGCYGTPVTITGTNFAGATAVTISYTTQKLPGGTTPPLLPAASFTVVNDTTITARVGEGSSSQQ